MKRNFLLSALGYNNKTDYLGVTLLFLNSILLGIWAVKHTIALRNILLALGVIISIIFIRRELFFGDIKLRIGVRSAMPLIFILLMFLWVISHLIFINLYPDIQIEELKGTWMRAFLATINGLAIGLLVRKNIRVANLLWFGILVSFLVLYAQYLPKAIESFQFYQYDPHGYIFHLKINGVLMGSILISGLGGLTIDLTRHSLFKGNLSQIFFCTLSVFIILFAYVFIFDSRNGIGISAFLFLFWGYLLLQRVFVNIKVRGRISNFIAPIVGLILLVATFAFFLTQQSAYNTGWNTYLEDFLMGIQSDKYVNWRDFNNLGMPISPSGRQVTASTYERTALIVEGIKIIAANPWGCGVLTQPFMKMLPFAYPGVIFVGQHATHSAWVEFGLAFGFPGLCFLIGALVVSAFNVIKDFGKSVAPVMTLSLILGILVLYMVGEVSTQHGVEILFYLLGLISILQLPQIQES